MKQFALALLTLWLAGSVPAQAQLGGLGLPSLPQTPNVGGVTQQLPNLRDAQAPVDLPTGNLVNLRRDTITSLLARHRDVLEADPSGEPIVRGEILALAPSDQALTAALARGFTVARRETIEDVGVLVALRVPAGVGSAAALESLRTADPNGVYDFDHLHLPSGGVDSAPAKQSKAAASVVHAGPRIGLVDGGVADQVSLRGAVANQRNFSGGAVTPTAHATAVASLLVGRGHGVEGSAPNGQLYVADVYGGAATGGSALALVEALGWLTSTGVSIINVSLVGPRNSIVEAAVASVVRRGFLIVAAVGNDGPAAPPLYPAAYPGVVGVTAVDAGNRVLVEAARGAQVQFAARGVWSAASLRGLAPVRGTSFAAPIVAGLLAEQTNSVADAGNALRALRAQARDLGAPGRDDIYGYGLVSARALVSSSH